MNYRKMLEDILKLVGDDFAEEMSYLATLDRPISQKDAKELAERIGRIYLISHQIHCASCANTGKYRT
jgi:hypothetical protein